MLFTEDEEDVEFDQAHKREMDNAVKTLNSRLEDLQTYNELITKHGVALQRSLSELESHDNAQDVTTKIKAINERATLFRISSNAMINVRLLIDLFHSTISFMFSRADFQVMGDFLLSLF